MSFYTNEDDHRVLFNKNKEDFIKIITVRDSLIKRYQSCQSYRFTLTAKSFWQECDSVKLNLDLPESFLEKYESDYMISFMSRCKLRYVKMNPGKIEYVFDGYEPDIIIKVDKLYHEYDKFKLQDSFYLVPYNVGFHQ